MGENIFKEEDLALGLERLVIDPEQRSALLESFREAADARRAEEMDQLQNDLAGVTQIPKPTLVQAQEFPLSEAV